MKRLGIIIHVFEYFIFAAFLAIATSATARAASSAPRLPYAYGQEFVVVQGYDTLPTHIKKDSYALDFSQNGCDAYGKSVAAAASGIAMFVSQEGYNGGYGTELIINHGNNRVSRYAHMIPDTITVIPGEAIQRGQIVGHIGDTGLVAGVACPAHPGTHLHFAMDIINPDGTFTALDPEPISSYMGMTAGKWYLSDNSEDDGLGNVPSVAASLAVGTSISIGTNTTNTINTMGSSIPIVSSPLSSVPLATTMPPTKIIPIGGVSTEAGTADLSLISHPTSSPDGSISTTTTITASSTNQQNPTSTILFEQLDDTANSPASWYDDNWFDLGNGFAGTLNALTLEGKVSGVDYFASHVSLQEFKDANYTSLIQQFTISDNAPFIPTLATTTFGGLSIPLKPYFYYRLATIQDYQNRSVILAGTTNISTGTVMSDNFVYGTGGVESTSTFFPFMTMEGIAPPSTIIPPPLTVPTDITESFDVLNMQIGVSWTSSTDPDWAANPLHYEINYSTSTTFNDNGWSGDAEIPVMLGNSYLIGVRAADNFGDVSAAATATWNFPAGFAPYTLSPELGYANQYFMVSSTSTLQSIQLFTTNFQTNARNPQYVGCSLALFYSDGPNSWETHPSDNGYGGYDCTGDPIFSFASSSITLNPGMPYQWIFQVQTGNPLTGGSVQFYGTSNNTAGGAFGDPSLVNARFVVVGNSGVLFAN